MRIREVELLTGLNRKAIRLYEDKGLLTVERSDNDYREYSAEDVSRLRRIAVLRRAGVSLGDIQLWQNRVISGKEMLGKRLAELRDAAGEAEDQVKLCIRLSDVIGQACFDEESDAEPWWDDLPAAEEGESEESALVDPRCPLVLGLDIGTTTISAAVVEPVSRRTAAVYTVQNHYNLPAIHPYERCQDPDRIFSKVKRLLDFLFKRFPSVTAIGVTGQMHGILYADAEGNALTPLYTWQDGRAGGGLSLRLCGDSGKDGIPPVHGVRHGHPRGGGHGRAHPRGCLRSLHRYGLHSRPSVRWCPPHHPRL